MFSAIQDEVNKIDNPDFDGSEATTELELEEAYDKLYETKVNLEDLDTNQENDELSNDDFNKLKDLVVSGHTLAEAYRNVLPAMVMEKTKNTIKDYEDELIDAIVSSDDADEYRASLDFIINNISTIYNDKEYNLTELKQRFDSKYN